MLKSAVFLLSGLISTNAAYCSGPNLQWYRPLGHCFEAVSSADNYANSQQLCADRAGPGMTGRLAVIMENELWTQLNSTFAWTAEFWIGLRTINSPSSDPNGWNWVDAEGNALGVLNFPVGVTYLLSGANSEDCIRITGTGHWYDSPCSKNYGALCEYFNPHTPPQVPRSPADFGAKECGKIKGYRYCRYF